MLGHPFLKRFNMFLEDRCMSIPYSPKELLDLCNTITGQDTSTVLGTLLVEPTTKLRLFRVCRHLSRVFFLRGAQSMQQGRLGFGSIEKPGVCVLEEAALDDRCLLAAGSM